MPKEKIKSDELFKWPGEIRIKFKDIFDMKEFYAAFHFWFEEYGWNDGYPSSKEGFWYETMYDERVSEGGAREMWIRWRLEKKPPQRDLIKYHIDIDFHILALTNTEVIKNGQKIKTNKGEVEITMNSYFQTLYTTNLTKEKGIIPSFKRAIFNTFQPMLSKRMYQIPEVKKELYQEIYVLQNFLKQWFRLKRYLPYEEVKSFHPSFAWPSHQKD
jgi:hypothetical protein